MNRFRQQDRDANSRVYPEDVPNHGTSIYDKLQLRIPTAGSDDETNLVIEKRTSEAYEVEEI